MKRHGWLLAVSAVALGLGFAPKLWADLAPGPHDSATREERLRQRVERLREHAAALASGLPHAAASGAPAPSGSAVAAPSGSTGAGGSRAEELVRRLAELAATRHDRRELHRAAIERMFGAHLSDPAVAAELKLHAIRTADLARVEFLAQNAREGAARQKLLARVAQLSAKERERHARRMSKVMGAARAAAPPPAAPNAGAPR